MGTYSKTSLHLFTLTWKKPKIVINLTLFMFYSEIHIVKCPICQNLKKGDFFCILPLWLLLGCTGLHYWWFIKYLNCKCKFNIFQTTFFKNDRMIFWRKKINCWQCIIYSVAVWVKVLRNYVIICFLSCLVF